MGTVYAAHDPKTRRTVALKVLSVGGQDDVRRLRWHREARAMALVSHPNIVPFFDVGTDDRHVFIAMKLVAGGDLHKVLRRRRFSAAETIELFAGIGRGLQAVHDAGLLHRDFKPQNVLVAPDTTPLLTDFGLARPQQDESGWDLEDDAAHRTSEIRLAPGTVTEAGRVVGTPRYMSPEQIEGQRLSVASDQFSFGVALYEALYSRHPFIHTDVESLHAEVLEGRVVKPAGRRVPKSVRDAVLRCLARDPAERFRSMQEVVDVLERSSGAASYVAAVTLCASAGLVAASLLSGG